MCSVVETFGGPAQYVRVKLDEKSVWEDFLEWLWVSFPLAPDTLYALCARGPTAGQEAWKAKRRESRPGGFAAFWPCGRLAAAM